MTKEEAIRRIRTGEWRKSENNGKGNIESICEIVRQIDEPKWHTGTPTEEGWYLLKLNHDGESKYNANYLWDIGFGKEWKYAYLGEVVKWQKIEGGEELDG